MQDLESLELFNPLFYEELQTIFAFLYVLCRATRKHFKICILWIFEPKLSRNVGLLELKKVLKYLNFRANFFSLACMISRGNAMHSKVYACMSRSGRSKGIFSTWSWRIGNLCTFTSGDIRHVINSNQTLSFSALLLLKILSSK